MIRRFLPLVVAAIFASKPLSVAADELPPDIVASFRSAKRVMLYSLEPNAHEGSGFHGFRILGYRTVDDAPTRQLLATTLQKDVRAGGLGALCFLPRHGVRLIAGRSFQDLVICYECGQVRLYSSGQADRTVRIAGDPTLLDGVLANKTGQPSPSPKAGPVTASDAPRS